MEKGLLPTVPQPFGTRSRMPSAHKQILNPSKSYLKLISIRNALCKQYDIV